MSLKTLTLMGKEIIPYLNDLAYLRIKVFQDFPYLYEGDMEYESEYLSTYIKCNDALMVLIVDNKKVVGASTAIPLQFESIEVKQPFIENGMKLENILYLGESVLLHQYRGKGIYSIFFNLRESLARKLDCSITTFCAVDRRSEDQRKPSSYMPLDGYWQQRGYKKDPQIHTYFTWKEVGEVKPTPKKLNFWLKTLC